ncbi:penicillin-binding transpeptidase domain-containing protein [Demetria terragena]|uniref:penicillin-binding transpeptidase domain-containing protein n=1 Tax=Demetria terragena TaxID=63959 RepID=UPI00058DDFDB|nr:penicillin-binding transpeptidase domain-containing protein [Demetria terragena]
MKAGRSGVRLAILGALAVALVLAMLGRLVQLQVVRGDDLAQQAQQQATRTIIDPALRGRILAADGTPLAANSSTTVLTLDPREVADREDGGAGLLRRVAPLVDRTPEELIARTKVCGAEGAPRAPQCFSGQPFEPIPIAADVPLDRALPLLERPEEFPGLGVRAEPRRAYPEKGVINAAHLLGHLTGANREDLQRNSTLTTRDVVGRGGLEQHYDDLLRGTPGRTTVSVDARGFPDRQVSQKDPVPGRDVVTHLDPTVQEASEKVLGSTLRRARADGNPGRAGAVVVLDASSGAVKAMASAPTYDPGVWAGGVTNKEYVRLTSAASGAPLRNRVTEFATAPASTFKAISVPAAMSQGHDAKGPYDCSANVKVGDRVFRNYESVAFGPVSMRRALEVSCDTVFYRWAFESWKKAGGLNAPTNAPDPFASTARSFGLGTPSGVDLPGESDGRIPDRSWKQRNWEATKTSTCDRAKRGYPELKDRKRAAYLTKVARENCVSGNVYRAGDAVNFAIGQGDVAATPLQMASAYAAVANGGTLWAPRVAAASQQPGGAGRRPVAQERAGTVAFPANSLATLRSGLADVTRTGTAKDAFSGFPLKDYPVSGKTGTAEVFGQEATSWFASYGPKTSSGAQYVVLTMITESGTGSTYAAPAARTIWDVLRQR